MWLASFHLHGCAHGVEEVDDDEGEDGEPLLPRETAHGYVLSPDGLKFEQVVLSLYANQALVFADPDLKSEIGYCTQIKPSGLFLKPSCFLFILVHFLHSYFIASHCACKMNHSSVNQVTT